MCLEFGSCFGSRGPQDYGRGPQDYGHEPSTAKHADANARPPAWSGADHSQQRNGNQGQGYYGNDHKASYLTVADEAGRKAHNDARKDHAVVAGAAATRVRDGHGYTATRYSAADETLKLPARNNKVGDDTGCKARFYEPADKEDTTGYHYPTTTAPIARCSFAVLITAVITDVIKNAVGRPRPDFFWRHFPDGKQLYDQVTGGVRTASPTIIFNGAVSPILGVVLFAITLARVASTCSSTVPSRQRSGQDSGHGAASSSRSPPLRCLAPKIGGLLRGS